MIRVWIAIFLVLFGMAELYQWMKQFTLPLPIYILGGAFLALASNYERRASFPWQRPSEPPPTAVNLPNSSQLPSVPQSTKPISFTIDRLNNKSKSSETTL